MTWLKKLLMLKAMISKENGIGGIAVLFDNKRLQEGGSITTKCVDDENYFITGIFDTGTTAKKTYVLSRWRGMEYASLRLYNTDDLTQNSADYWSVCQIDGSYGTSYAYEFESVGRYIICTIPKAFASQSWLKYKDGEYIFKGTDVT